VHRRGNPIADALNLAVAQSLRRQSFPQLVDVRWLRKSHVHVCSALKIYAVKEPVVMPYGQPADDQKNAAQGIEILRLRHPMDVGLSEELEHAASATSL
jgi:hypothetical protein